MLMGIDTIPLCLNLIYAKWQGENLHVAYERGLPMKRFQYVGVLLLFCLLGLSACQNEPAQVIGVVDVERVLTESVPGKAAIAHLEQAKAVLQKGLKDLEEEWKEASDEEKRRVLTEGLTALNRQMAVEEQAARKVVADIMFEEIRGWRLTHKASYVIARQNLLDADKTVDVTDEILHAMASKTAKFDPLPTVNIKKRESALPKKEKRQDPAAK